MSEISRRGFNWQKGECVDVPAKKKKPSRKSQLEDSFADELAMFGVPTPVRQHRFHPVRLWRFDFCWPEQKIACEIHGGVFIPGTGHNRGRSMELDFEKSNEAQLLGWKVFTFGPSQVRGKKRTTQASFACEFLWKLFHPKNGTTGDLSHASSPEAPKGHLDGKIARNSTGDPGNGILGRGSDGTL